MSVLQIAARVIPEKSSFLAALGAYGFEAQEPVILAALASGDPILLIGHIDRTGAYAARHAALRAVQTGASACRVTVAYAPNRDLPLDVVYEMDERADRLPQEWFAHSAVRDRYRGGAFVAGLGVRGHFGDTALPWNDATKLREAPILETA